MEMIRTLVVYDSRYGSTEGVANTLSLILGPSNMVKVDEIQPEHRGFDLFVIGAPVYKGVISPKIWNFVRDNLSWLRDKKIALFSTSIDRKDGETNLESLKKMLGASVILSRALGGRMYVDKLSANDLLGMEAFCKRKGFLFQDIDTLVPEEVVEFGLDLKRARDMMVPRMPTNELRRLIDAFLASHNICALATGYRNRVRATPLEYLYKDGVVYFLSEGGEKFANLVLNNMVSLTVYDPYESMRDLAGIQLSGAAYFVKEGTDEFKEVLRLKGISYDTIASLRVRLNMIKVVLQRAEFLCARLKGRGYEITQTYDFPEFETQISKL